MRHSITMFSLFLLAGAAFAQGSHSSRPGQPSPCGSTSLNFSAAAHKAASGGGGGKTDGIDAMPAAGWPEATADVDYLLQRVHPLSPSERESIASFDRSHRSDPAARLRLRVALLGQALAP